MVRYLAFLRAVNVGGRTIKMETLRALVADLGFDEVETFIASGNVIFLAPRQGRAALERRLEEQLGGGFGYEVPTFVRTAAEVAAIAGHDPFPDLDPADVTAMDVGLLRAAPTAAARRRIAALSNDSDRVVVEGRELYWARFVSMRETTLTGAVLSKALGARNALTVRGVNTMRRLAKKYPPG